MHRVVLQNFVGPHLAAFAWGCFEKFRGPTLTAFCLGLFCRISLAHPRPLHRDAIGGGANVGHGGQPEVPRALKMTRMTLKPARETARMMATSATRWTTKGFEFCFHA
jgi:hypothetical protein